MASLIIAGISVPVAPNGIRRDRLDGTDRARAFDQSYRASVTGNPKRDFYLTTPPIRRVIADDLERIILSTVTPQTCSGTILGGGENLIIQSEDFSLTWTALGTSPLYAANAHTASGITLDLIEDNDTGNYEGFAQTGITFTGNAVKAVSLHVKYSTSARSVFALHDTVAGAYRLRTALTWVGGLPSLAMSEGTSLGYETLSDGVFRLLFATTSVTAVNAHQLYVLPATDVAIGPTDVGAIYAGGVQVENSATPTAYVKTTTAAVSTLSSTFCVEITDWTPVSISGGHAVVIGLALHEV